MNRFLWLIVTLLLVLAGAEEVCAVDPQRALTQYVLETWSTSEGLPLPAVSAVAQTSAGYLWIGTQEGLARFDGLTFRTFDENTAPELTTSYVRSLLATRDGSLWIGTMGGGLFRFEEGTWTHYGEAQGLPDDRILSLSEGADGGVWGGTLSGGVFHLRNGEVRVIRKSDGLASDFVSVVHYAYDGTVWAGGPEGLSRIRGASIEVLTEADGLSSRRIASVIQGRDGRVWIGTNGKGLNRIDQGQVRPVLGTQPFSNDHVLSLLEDSRGSIWFGTMQHGLWRLERGRLESLDSDDGLPGNVVTALMEDREGTIWAGTNEGLAQLKDARITSFGSPEGLPSDSLRAVYQQRDGTVWLASRGGLIRMTDVGHTPVIESGGLSSENILSLWGGEDGSLWVGTLDRGLIRMHQGRVTRYSTREGLAGDMVLSILQDREGALWVGTATGLSRLADGTISTFRKRDGGPSGDAISVLHQDREGTLWIGTTDGGLSRFRDGTFQPAANSALRAAMIMSIHEDQEGVLWIGTLGDGLFRKAEEHVRAITRKDGLFSNSVLHVTEDDRGQFWMSSPKGIFRVSSAEIDRFLRGQISSITAVAYGKSDGLKTQGASGGTQPAGWKSLDGRLWFPTGKGVVVVDPARLGSSGLAPKVIVERTLVDGKQAASDASSFPPGSSTLQFDYTGLTLVAPDKVTFRYKLQGFDPEWIEAGTRRAAFYTNLSPGNYEFRVLAANSDGIWSEKAASRKFRLEPRLYQRIWFLPALALLLLIALFLFHRQRLRVVQRRALRLAELEKSVVRGQKMESLGQMASGIAHDFNNALMTSLPWADLLQRKFPDDETVQKASGQIRKSVQRGKEVTRQLLDFAQPKKPQKRAVELGAFVEDQLVMVRPSIRPEIEIVIHAPAPVHVLVDPAQLSQAILNLALNARDAIPGSGTLTFAVRLADPRESSSHGLPDEQFGALSISDTGTGMDRQTMEKIFDPFFTTKGVGEGTGLGLAVAHRIMEQNGGTIAVESQFGKGTTFHLLLPLSMAVDEAVKAEKPSALPVGRLDGIVILLVDDDLGVVEGLSACLEAEGARVHHAETGPAALRLLDTGFNPHRVILDLGLPEMSGDIVHGEIRKRNAGLPVIISSGYGDSAKISELLADPETRYLQTPYEMEDLISMILGLDRVTTGG